jgi:plastocyanin
LFLARHASRDKADFKVGTNVLNSGESKTLTFDKPGSYYYICTPNPWMYGQIIVE